MSAARWLRRLFLSAILVGLAATPAALPVNDYPPRPEPVAETRLLMEALNLPNYRGLEKLLKQPPKELEAWSFARGQALLIAETGNLLMLRPPHNQGQLLWLERSAGLRTAATNLARAAAARNYDQCRTGLVGLANACNHCHQTFRVKTLITPFANEDEKND
jgi:hypothetical protein